MQVRLGFLLTSFVLLAAASIMVACDPCASVTGCMGNARLTIAGRLLIEETGKPAAGARIDFVRTSGVALASDSVRDVTDADGNFVVRVDAAGPGTVLGEIVLRSAIGASPAFAYRVLELAFQASGEAGEANVLPAWSTRPIFPDIAQIVGANATPDALTGIAVEFRRTGGVRLIEGDVFRTITRSGGEFELFDRRVTPIDAGEIVGDLYIDLGGYVHRGYRLRSTPEFRRNAVLWFIDVSLTQGVVGARGP